MDEHLATPSGYGITVCTYRRGFWKGFGTCLALGIGLIILSYCNEFRRRWGHTTPTDIELAKIAALLNTEGEDPGFTLSRFEYKYYPIGLDKFGFSAASITHTANTPPWDTLLKDWQRLDHRPDDLNRVRMADWMADSIDLAGPTYIRWVTINYAAKEDLSDTVRTSRYPQLCVAAFDKNDPNVLYIATEGELLFPHTTLVPGITTGTLDWSRLAWD